MKNAPWAMGSKKQNPCLKGLTFFCRHTSTPKSAFQKTWLLNGADNLPMKQSVIERVEFHCCGAWLNI